MSFKSVTETAGILAVDIMRNGFHQPFVDGKANRETIEDQITIGIMSGALKYNITQEIVDLAVDLIDDLIVQYGVKQ